MPLIGSKQVPGGLPEVTLPPSVVQRNHSRDMADIMDSLARSGAADARHLTYDKLRWALAYDQGQDPDQNDTRDPVVFATLLAQASKVYLIARGGKFRGCAILNETPPQIMAKFEERARLICGTVASPDDQPSRPILALFDEWVESHPNISSDMVAVVRFGLERLVCGAE